MINQRIDKWLWAARFYKTRTIAMAAVKSGKVRINGRVVKPAHAIAVGDCLQVRRGAFFYDITVQALSTQRRNAREAEKLYRESDESQRQRELLHQKMRLSQAVSPRPAVRPDKKARRQLRELRYFKQSG